MEYYSDDLQADAIIKGLKQRLASIQACVNRQAEDLGLWFVAKTAAEAYLQQELRGLHAIIEAEAMTRRIAPPGRG